MFILAAIGVGLVVACVAAFVVADAGGGQRSRRKLRHTSDTMDGDTTSFALLSMHAGSTGDSAHHGGHHDGGIDGGAGDCGGGGDFGGDCGGD